MADAKKPRKAGRPDTSNMDKGQKFATLANLRVSKVLAGLKNVRRLANARNYTFTAEQVERIRSVLAQATKEVNDAFATALKGGAVAAEKATFDINAKE